MFGIIIIYGRVGLLRFQLLQKTGLRLLLSDWVNSRVKMSFTLLCCSGMGNKEKQNRPGAWCPQCPGEYIALRALGSYLFAHSESLIHGNETDCASGSSRPIHLDGQFLGECDSRTDHFSKLPIMVLSSLCLDIAKTSSLTTQNNMRHLELLLLE